MMYSIGLREQINNLKYNIVKAHSFTVQTNTSNASSNSTEPTFLIMKKAIAAVALIALVGCRKDDPPQNTITPEPTPGAYLINTPGTYCLYQWYSIDSTGTATQLTTTDSMFIAGDTVLNGATYTHWEGTYYGVQTHRYFRDSSGSIIDQNGTILWSYATAYDTVNVSNVNPGMVTYSIIQSFNNPLFTMPAGIWGQDTLSGGNLQSPFELQQHYYTTNGTPFTPCDSAWITHTGYMDGLGELYSQTAFMSQLQQNCTYMERRLVYYRIME